MRAHLQIAALAVIATTLAVGNSSADPVPPSIGVAAFAADRAGNYAEALRLFQMIDAESDAAFTGQASVDYFTAQRMGRGALHDHFQLISAIWRTSCLRIKLRQPQSCQTGGLPGQLLTSHNYCVSGLVQSGVSRRQGR